jgi:hypothetical protein
MNEEKILKMKDRENEKGAAMVMALLISFLLLVASAGILLESSMNTANVTDATADQQAYNAAESGIQSAINVLRGNVAPSTAPTTEKIDFVKALKLSSSNLSTDTSSFPRLSRWINYSYTPSGATNPDRSTIGTTTANPYTPQKGYAFSLSLSDPDNTGTYISYATTGRFFDSDSGNSMQKTYGSATIVYTPTTVTNLDVSSGSHSTDLGKFTVTVNGGGTVSAFNRFEIIMKMTKPYKATRVIRGYIETGTISSASMPKFIFDSRTFTLMGSITTLDIPSGASVYDLGPPQRVGYEAPLQAGINTIGASITPAEPTRLLIRSVGYGPRGASKQLEAIVQKNFFNGLTAPATLTLVGPPSTTTPATTFMFNPGSSNVTQYSGDDVVSTDIISPIGTTNPDNLDAVQDSVDGQPPHPFNGKVIGTPSDVSEEMPEWLQNPLQLETAVQSLAGVAKSSGGFYPSGSNPTDGQFGNSATAKGITFIDHDATFTGDGGGILVVTGKLTFHGNFSFNGLIIVTGAGGVQRSGGGGGTIQGNIVIAPYEHNKMSDLKYDPITNAPYITETTQFLSPQYDLSGGDNSTIVYNSSSVANGLSAISNFALGVAEK